MTTNYEPRYAEPEAEDIGELPENDLEPTTGIEAEQTDTDELFNEEQLATDTDDPQPVKTANNRSLRTLLQTLAAAIITTTTITVASAIANTNPTDLLTQDTWISYGALAGNTALAAAIAWIQNYIEGKTN